MGFITQNRLFFIVYAALLIILNYVFFLYLFILPSIILFKKNVKSSWREGTSLINNRKAGTIGKILFSYAAFFLGTFIIIVLAVLCLAAYTKLFYPATEAEAVFRFLYKRWSSPLFLTAGTIGTIWLFSVIIVLFHNYREDSRPAPIKTPKNLFSIVKRTVIIIGTVILLLLFSETELGGNFIYPDRSSTQIIAHRAGATFAPENTMAALNQAIEDRADAAEIDVQQLKDGTLIVMHDSNFKRTTGVNKNVWEVTYPEIKDYDAGFYFSPDYAGEPVPTLEDMLKIAKNKINLMIELKLTGRGQGSSLETQTLELINRYGMINQCTIASMDLKLLENIKKTEPKIDTVYITPCSIPGTLTLTISMHTALKPPPFREISPPPSECRIKKYTDGRQIPRLQLIRI